MMHGERNFDNNAPITGYEQLGHFGEVCYVREPGTDKISLMELE